MKNIPRPQSLGSKLLGRLSRFPSVWIFPELHIRLLCKQSLSLLHYYSELGYLHLEHQVSGFRVMGQGGYLLDLLVNNGIYLHGSRCFCKRFL